MMFENVEKLCIGLNNIAKIIAWHTIAVSTFKKDRKTTDDVNIIDDILIAVQELKSQKLDKNVANVKLEHERIVNYNPSGIVKDVAILRLGHVQLINYLNQYLDKEIAEVSL